MLTAQAALLVDPNWHVDDAAGVKGYTFGRPGWLFHQLGPVVATDAATARDMVTRCLSPLGGRKLAMDVPLVVDAEWLDFLQSAGFVEEHSRAAVRDRRPGVRVKPLPVRAATVRERTPSPFRRCAGRRRALAE